MKNITRLALALIFLASFIADHSFIDSHLSSNNEVKVGIANSLSTALIFSQNDHSNEHNEQDCADCILGFCSHQVMIPIQFVRNLDLNIVSAKQVSFDEVQYQDPFYSKLKRPPIV